jgi:hypothetical protein
MSEFAALQKLPRGERNRCPARFQGIDPVNATGCFIHRARWRYVACCRLGFAAKGR